MASISGGIAVGNTVTASTAFAQYGLPMDMIGETYGSTTVVEAQEKLESGINLKTLNGRTLLGSGDYRLTKGCKKYLKYSAIGDSISYGAGSTSGNTSWCNILADKIGATLQKRAGSGQKIWENLLAQINGTNTDAELITVMMGVNDISDIGTSKTWYGTHNVEGTLTENTIADVINQTFNDSNTSTGLYADYGVIGRFSWCLQHLQVRCPNARIIVITLTPYNDNAGVTKMVRSQGAVCDALNIEHYDPTMWPEYNTNFFQALQADTLHPNDAGYKVIAGWVYKEL